MKTVALIVGTRPQIIKSSHLIHLLRTDEELELEIVHTGQHYNDKMTAIFFREFALPDPIVTFNIVSETHAQQTATMMIHLENLLKKQKFDLVVVPGDTNSTIAGALTAAKLQIPVAHIEAGARSFDMSMPEEVNRRLTDHCSTVLFTPTEQCTKNLECEGISINQIKQTGDTMYDVFLQQRLPIERNTTVQELDLKSKTYILVTAHRPENVDNPQNLKSIVEAMIALNHLTIVFPVHPRTQKQLRKFKLYDKLLKQRHIKFIQPTGYHGTLNLMKHAQFVMTDSGGIQKEAFWAHTPCITLRENTEWVETIQLEANYLTGSNQEKILETAHYILENEAELQSKLETVSNPFGDGTASQQIRDSIKEYFSI